MKFIKGFKKICLTNLRNSKRGMNLLDRNHEKTMILGILFGILLLPGIFKWVGIPTFDKLLHTVLGSPNTVNIVLAILLTITLVFIVLKLPKLTKRWMFITTKSADFHNPFVRSCAFLCVNGWKYTNKTS